MAKAVARSNFNFRLTCIFRLFQYCQPSLDHLWVVDSGAHVHQFPPTFPIHSPHSRKSVKSLRFLIITINLVFLLLIKWPRWALKLGTACIDAIRLFVEAEKRVVSSANRSMFLPSMLTPNYFPPNASCIMSLLYDHIVDRMTPCLTLLPIGNHSIKHTGVCTEDSLSIERLLIKRKNVYLILILPLKHISFLSLAVDLEIFYFISLFRRIVKE